MRDGETGLLVDSENHRAVAAAITALLADPARAARLGEQGRRAVVEHYNWDRVVADFMAHRGRIHWPGGGATSALIAQVGQIRTATSPSGVVVHSRIRTTARPSPSIAKTRGFIAAQRPHPTQRF